MSWQELAKTSQVLPGTLQSFDVAGRKILAVNFEGRYFAMKAVCTHMGGDLSKGKLKDKIVTCPRHGARFDVTTGECVSGPQIAFFKLKTEKAEVFETKVEGDSLKVNLA